MKNLNTYILEKFKISKDINISSINEEELYIFLKKWIFDKSQLEHDASLKKIKKFLLENNKEHSYKIYAIKWHRQIWGLEEDYPFIKYYSEDEIDKLNKTDFIDDIDLKGGIHFYTYKLKNKNDKILASVEIYHSDYSDFDHRYPPILIALDK